MTTFLGPFGAVALALAAGASLVFYVFGGELSAWRSGRAKRKRAAHVRNCLSCQLQEALAAHFDDLLLRNRDLLELSRAAERRGCN